MSETPYEEFRRDFIDRPQRDGPDLSLLDALSPVDRQRAERLLLTHVHDSLHAISGLAHLRSEAAVKPLRVLLRSRGRYLAVFAARALWKINGDPQALELLIRTVRRRPWFGLHVERAYAAAALRWIKEPAALAALINAVDDRSGAVAGNAEFALGERLRLNAEIDALNSGYLSVAELQALARARLAAGEEP